MNQPAARRLPEEPSLQKHVEDNHREHMKNPRLEIHSTAAIGRFARFDPGWRSSLVWKPPLKPGYTKDCHSCQEQKQRNDGRDIAGGKRGRMARHAENAFGRKHHDRSAHRIAACVAPPAGTLTLLEGHAVNVARPPGFAVHPPEHGAAFLFPDRGDPRKMAGFATHPYMRVMGYLFIVPVMAGQAVCTFLSGMSKLRRFRVAG